MPIEIAVSLDSGPVHLVDCNRPHTFGPCSLVRLSKRCPFQFSLALALSGVHDVRSANACRPFVVIRTRRTSIARPPATTRSVVAVASPVRTSSTMSSIEKPCARELAELLRAVAAFAGGGLTALADQRTDSARKLLGQLK